MSIRTYGAIGLSMLAATAAFGQASFGPSGYSENFDSMGSSGTAPPTGWRNLNPGTGFGSNTTWATSIPASGALSVATHPVTMAGTVLSAITTPTANNNNGYNAAASPSLLLDRVLATAPTTVAGNMFQLSLNNDSGAGFNPGDALTIGFDTIRYSSVGTANELPGFWLFASLDGTTWANVATVASPNPTITTVPNTAGTTSRSVDFVLPSAWGTGSTMYLRWVDDNAVQTSPDQIIGLNNFTIVPTPGSALLLGLGFAAMGRRRR